MLSAILWDNDGTLVDTEPLYYQATRELLLTLGVEVTPEQYARIGLDEGRSIFDLAAERGIARDLIEARRQARNLRYMELITGGVPLRPGIMECLGALHRRVPMGIVTSSQRDHFERMHETTGLLPYFDFILTREDFRNTKPDPEPYLTAARRFDLEPARCLVIEDTRRGVIAAKRAGMECWAIPSSFAPADGFLEADRVCADAAEVTTQVLRRLGSEKSNHG
jgi:HAD superfamily hydrolase (TIGR01509 family)